MRVYRGLTLSTRLTLVALIALVPLAVLIVLSNLSDQDARREAGVAEASRFAQSAATAFEGFAREVDGFTDAAAIELGSQDGPISNAGDQAYLSALGRRYPNLSALFVTDLNGRILAQASGDDTGRDLSSRPYITLLQSGTETVWTGALTGLQSGELIGTFGRIIHSPSGEPVAFLIAAFRPSNLLAALPPDFPHDANLVIVDNQGRLVFSARDPDLLAGPEVQQSPHVQRALAGEFVTIDSEQTAFDEGSRYGALAPVPRMSWAVGYTRSMSTLNSQLRSDLIGDLAGLLVIMGLILGVMLVFARQMTRPLRRLAVAAAQLSAGQQVTVAISGADPDVDKLQRAFARMSAAVLERESQLREQANTLSTLGQVGASIASELDLKKAVQAVTDAGTRLTEAEYGAFFYNQLDEHGESYLLHTISGVESEAFADFPNPRNTEIFAPTFRGEAPVRLPDVSKDPRYGRMAPYHGMPDGHPAVRSYLAVPVVSGQGNVLGGLFFGHSTPGVFTQQHEDLALGIASWASVALDNARLYEEAQRIQNELRAANAAKDEFLGVISHELRTPMTTIYGGLRILDAQKSLMREGQADELVSSMAEEGARLVRLIENLLAIARMELGREFDLGAAPVNELVKESLASFSRLRPDKPVRLALDAALPIIEVESTYFQQILANLLSNADKYSPQKSEIDVQIQSNDDSVCISVSDSGPGVPEGELERIFESFYRSERTAGIATGQGLGLSVCRKLVEAQGGEIWAENRSSGGFRVSLRFSARGFQGVPGQTRAEASA